MTDIREALMDALRSHEHAPMETHSQYDGSCLECPWPVHELPPEDIADAILEQFIVIDKHATGNPALFDPYNPLATGDENALHNAWVMGWNAAALEMGAETPRGESDDYEVAYRKWRDAGTKSMEALLQIWRGLGGDREYATFGDDPQVVVDEFFASRRGEAESRLGQIADLLGSLDLDSDITREGTAWGSILREALSLARGGAPAEPAETDEEAESDAPCDCGHLRVEHDYGVGECYLSGCKCRKWEAATDDHWLFQAARAYPGDEYENYEVRTAFGRGYKAALRRGAPAHLDKLP